LGSQVRAICCGCGLGNVFLGDDFAALQCKARGQVIFVNDDGVVLWDFDINGSLSRYRHRYIIGILDDVSTHWALTIVIF
jgi:hypothetical protein